MGALYRGRSARPARRRLETRLRPAGYALARLAASVVALPIGAAASSCAIAPASESCAGRACLSERYFDALPGPSPATCATVAPGQDLGETRDVRLYWGDGRGDDSVILAGSRVQRFFHPYGLAFGTGERATAAPVKYALSGTAAQIDPALAAAQLPTDRPPTADETRRANRALGEVMFRDLRAFVESHSAAATITLVVVEHVLEPALDAYLFGAPGPTMLRFGISPSLLAPV